MPSPFSSSSYSSITSSSPSSTSSIDIIMSRCIGELHFDVPLISTRRSHRSTHSDPNPNQAYSTDTSRSIPFLWERAPGVPKDGTQRNAEEEEEEEEEVFTPRPPPGRWQPPNLNESAHDAADSYSTSDDASNVTDLFSDALERISLSESQGIPCRLSAWKDRGPGVNRAPSFIMNRFLPAANALAASSAAAATTKPSNRTRARSGGSRDPSKLGRARHSSTAEATRKIRPGQRYADASPTKACGIMLLFPWSMKSTVCGLDRPIQCQTPNATSLEELSAQRNKKKAASGSGMSSDDGLSSKAWKSPGWGLPFLDASRVLRRKEKSRGFVDVERESPRRKDGRRGAVSEIGRPIPALKPQAPY